MFFSGTKRQISWTTFWLGLSLALAAGGASAADLSQAVVRQKVNVVTIAPSLSGPARPASTGSVVANDNVVRTGTESRAELEFSDLTLARLGANSIFSFDAQARALTCNQGAILFAKPSNSGRVEVRAGAITAAITGSTGFVSNRRAGAKGRQHDATNDERATMLGMLEGKLRGSATWRDGQGRNHNFSFHLGPGEMIVAHPDRRPVIVQFDIPRFVRTSPLITAFNSSLPNAAQLNRAIADYNSDASRGFVEPSTVLVASQQSQFGWVNSVNHNSFDASVDSLGRSPEPDGGGFVDVGGSGIIRGQLIWETFADLDLHLTLPDGQEVYYANTTATFNHEQASAALDHDNRGGTIDVPPSQRVENIAITGTPSAGGYQFFVDSFSTPNASDAFTLTVSGGGHTQTISGNLPSGQTTQPVTVNFPGR
ncbi:MAG TPA: FecR domain-containing protein [Chthoniobacterales bacterium]|nr:FecR domain-containing protein [Chthoniobacterales bacterium]